MENKLLSVRELQFQDIDALLNYWYNADPVFLTGMGVNLKKVPDKEDFRSMLSKQLEQSYLEKTSYCLIWLLDGIPVGHSNISKIIFSEEAFMHLHLWEGPSRKKGSGVQFVRLSIPFFFNKYQLKKLYCEPYALNPAPNKTLPKAGFCFVKKYLTTPGWLNFEQEVNLWEMSREYFEKLQF